MTLEEMQHKLLSLVDDIMKLKKELEDTKSVAEFQQKCNIERGFRVKELEEELKVYKKALELACWDTMCNCLHDDYYNDLLQKARAQNNDT